VVIDEAIAEEGRRAFQARGAYFLNPQEMELLARALVTPQRLPNPALVGKSAMIVAQKSGITAPEGTRVLVAPLTGVGRDFPLSIEKLCPVLSWYVVSDWRAGCERCIEILRYGGMGHTMSVHSQNEDVILQFGLKKPAFRICVNTPTTHGSIGLTTGLDPAMTLGCGGWGGNITSDNISPRHLLNIKRLAYEVRPATTNRPDAPASASSAAVRTPALPKAPTVPASKGIAAPALAARIDAFLSARGYRPDGAEPATSATSAPTVPASLPSAPPSNAAERPADFICEDDVRAAIKAGRKLVLGEKTIVTPAARDLGESSKTFVYAGWPQ
jgi:acetaldehyde dehydrogenase (acetylating)